MARKRVNVMSLSFLDAMTCGFGAVVLFFMIINATMDRRRDAIVIEETGEVDRIELRVLAGQRNLVQKKNDLAKELEDQAITQGLTNQVLDEIQTLREEFAELLEDTTAKRESIEALQADLESLEEESKRLSAASVTPEDAGNRIRSFVGEGNRQYLTGLRMGGRRVLILVDVSTSMLDKTLVNIIRRRNMSEAERRRAPKWRQTVATVDWLSAQLEPGTDFQIYGFNDTAFPLVEGSEGTWLTVKDGQQLEDAVLKLRSMAPSGGSSLGAAVEIAATLKPKPDNIYLLTDGLPTVGTVATSRRGVTGKERMRHFQRAVRRMPVSVPVNVILFAMEGDPNAAHAYWELALNTGGSMMAPSEDWP